MECSSSLHRITQKFTFIHLCSRRVCLVPALGQQGRGPHSVGWHAGCVSGGLLSLKWLQGPQGVSWLPGKSGQCSADCRDSPEKRPSQSLEGPWPRPRPSAQHFVTWAQNHSTGSILGHIRRVLHHHLSKGLIYLVIKPITYYKQIILTLI